jgi:hypothetical protein
MHEWKNISTNFEELSQSKLLKYDTIHMQSNMPAVKSPAQRYGPPSDE